MPWNIPRICISSASGSGGKTMLALGLGRSFTRHGLKVKPYKKGPDYIDSAWLRSACHTRTTNLDLYFMPPDALYSLFMSSARGADFAIIEGNRGLYDGMDDEGTYSTATLARFLKTPILLCLNCAKTTRTMAAVIQGLINFEKDLDFCGVVLNRVASSRHETALRRAIENHTPLKVLGALPKEKRPILSERHMGLASLESARGGEADRMLDRLGDLVANNCDVPAIIERGSIAPQLDPLWEVKILPKTGPIARIGYVMDKALWFYYPENLDALKNCGANLIQLSMFDESRENFENWENISGLYLGGGFPEDYAQEIARSPFLKKIKAFANAGMPIYAECGGFILLCEKFERDGCSWPMGGVFSETVHWHPLPMGLGYVEGQVVKKNVFFPEGLILRGHEFHYSLCEERERETCLKLARGCGLVNSGRDALTVNNVWAGFTHIFAAAIPCWARNFTDTAAKFARGE